MKKTFVSLAFLLSVVSCNTPENRSKSVEVVKLTEKTLPPVQPLKLEEIKLPEEYTMGDGYCLVYQDTILLVLKDGDPYPMSHMLTLVNMNTGEKIGEYFTRGLGPEELLSTLPRFSHNRLDIHCYTTGKLVAFNVDSAIVYGNDYTPNIIIRYNNRPIGDFGSMDDTLFLTTNPYYLAGCKVCKENAKLPEFYWYGISGFSMPEYKDSDYKKIKYLTSDVSGSSISINKGKKRVVCCYNIQPYIRIFDLDLNLTKEIVGPEPDDGIYIPDKNLNFMYFKDGIDFYYHSATCDNDNIFVFNYRIYKYPFGRSLAEKMKESTEIFRLDWDGNVIGRYSAKGNHIFLFTYSSNSNSLYLWIRDDDGEYHLYTAKLD